MKVIIPTYSFDATAGQITIVNYSPINLEQLLLITNTTRNIIIYNFADPNLGATISNNVITLSTNTGLMENSDKLQIFVESYIEPSTETTLSAVNLEIQKSNTKLDSLTAVDYATSIKQDLTNTLLDVLTAKQTTVNLDVSAINLNTDEIEGLIANSNTRLDVLTAIDYATEAKQDVTNTLLDALTAKQTTVNLDVSAINLNTDELEDKLDLTNSLLSAQLGQSGFVFLTGGASPITGNFSTFQVVSACKIASIAATNSSTNGLTEYELPVTFSFSGPITEIQLTYGAALVYKL